MSYHVIAVGRDMTYHGVQADVWRTLCDLGNAARKSTKRGRRGVVKRQRGIAVITGFRPRNIIYDRTEPGKIISATNKNLIPVQLSANPGFHMTTKVTLCVLNPRSACNKTSEIYDHIQEHDIDIMVLTESRLTGKDKDIVVTKALTPDGYSLINSHRKTGRGGGIVLVHKSSIKATSCNTYKNITACEAFSAKLTSNGKSITLLAIYQPPSNKRSTLPVSEFFKGFSDMLDDCETIQEGVIIVGDFNFHMDDSNGHHSKRLTDLLNCHGMCQYVNEPTHVGGHILDLIISRPQASITDVMVKDLFEDHYAVHCHIDLSKPPFPREERVYRK